MAAPEVVAAASATEVETLVSAVRDLVASLRGRQNAALTVNHRDACRLLGISVRHAQRLKQHGLWPIPALDLHTARPLYAVSAIQAYVDQFRARPIALVQDRHRGPSRRSVGAAS